MVACFENVRCCINVSDVPAGGGIPKEYASVVIVVQFTVTKAWCLDTHMRPKSLEFGYIGLSTVQRFIGCHFCDRVDESIVEID